MKQSVKIIIGIVIFLLILLGCAHLAYGDSLAIQGENDLLDYLGSDRHYTHGTRIGYIHNDAKATDLDLKYFDGYGIDESFAVGQLIYTPDEIEETELIEDDRPYAGWLYGEYGRYYSKFDYDGAEQHFFAVQLGIVGPSSLSEQSQKKVHEWTGSKMPEGWDNQLNDELGINLVYQKKDRFPVWKRHVDFTSHYGLALGNVVTFANAGGMIRVGPNLPDKFQINKFEPTPRVFNGKSVLRWLRLDESYVYVDVDGRFVLRNIFLDGNTFSDSHSVDKEYFVGDAEVGISASVWKFDLMMGYVFRSKEFEGQERINRFGAARIIYNF